MRIFGPERSCSSAIGLCSRAAISRTLRDHREVLLVRAVREVEADDVDARLDQRARAAPGSREAGPTVATILVRRIPLSPASIARIGN